jgi:cellulose biosynthesis protein BcsQ
MDQPRWTDLEVIKLILGTLVGAIAAISSFVWWLVNYWYRKKHQTIELQNRSLQQLLSKAEADRDMNRDERQRIQDQLLRIEEDLKEGTHPRLSVLKERIEESRDKLCQLHEDSNERENQLEQVRLNLAERGAELESAVVQIEEHERRKKVHAHRIQRALKLEGLIWEAHVPHHAPPFRPLSDRRAPIISVLNLKGGVGKTTLTANLGTQLADLDRRVLLVDLDLQGSLTNLFIKDEDHKELYDNRKLIQNYLDQAVDQPTAKLMEYVQPSLEENLHLIATADTLAYTEMNLTLKWLLRTARRDARFLLRKALHQKQVTRNFDVILLDCPPLLNVSCVNALVASDYVLIPMMPSAQVTNRIAPFLKLLQTFRANLNPDLKILGVVANRTTRTELTSEERARWSTLRDNSKDVWGEDVYLFETNIRQNTEIRKNEDARRPLGKSDEMYPTFRKLAEEVLQRLPVSATQKTVSQREGSAV